VRQQPYPEVVGALVGEFGTVPVEVIERCVASEARRFQDARITAYVSILVERAARQRVREFNPG
jgi:hypothetical protein